MQNNRWLQALIVLLVIIASAWLAGQVWTFLMQFSNILLLFFLAWLLAFVLSPIARAMQRRGVPKTLSVGVVYLALAVTFGIGGWFIVPAIISQVTGLIDQRSAVIDVADKLFTQASNAMKSFGMAQADLTSLQNEITRNINSVAFTALQNTLGFLQSIATFAFQLILVLLLSFYFMNDGDRIFGGMLGMLPPRWQDEARLVALSLEKSFGGFLRGQLVFALIYGVFTAVIMIMPPFQLNYVIVASIVAGLCMIIPLVGNFLAYIPPILVCLITPDKAGYWGWLLLVEFVMQSLMMNFIGPRVMSSAIGIHPLYVVAAMLTGGQVAGLWGALFGIPIAGALNLIGRPLMRRMRYQTTLYQEPSATQLPTSAFLTGPLALSMAQGNPNLGLSPGETQVLTGAAQALKDMTPATATGTLQGRTSVSAAMPADAATAAQSQQQPQYQSATQPQLPPELDPDHYMLRRSPTLTMRTWRLVFSLASRARTWAGKRAAARASRQ